MGEADTAYDRHKVTVKKGKWFRNRRKKYPDGYVSELRVHCKAGHSDIKDGGCKAPLVANCDEWLKCGAKSGAGGTVFCVCDSIEWCLQKTRDPTPPHVLWYPRNPGECEIRQKRAANSGVKRVDGCTPVGLLFYWLDISGGLSIACVTPCCRIHRRLRLRARESCSYWTRLLCVRFP